MRSRFFFLFLFGAALLGRPAAVCAHGDLHESIAEASRRIAESPGDATLYFQRAEFHRLHEDDTAAEADYRRACELSPGLAAPLLGMAELRFGMNRPAESLPWFDAFLKENPTHIRALYLRAQALAQTGAWEKADADLAAAIALAKPPGIELFLARADGLARHGRMAEALRCLEEGSAGFGGRSPTLEQRALEIEEAAGDSAAALRRLGGFVAAGLRPDIWLARKARLLDKMGRHGEARLAWKSAADFLEKIPPEKRQLPENRQLAEEICAALAKPAVSP